jgi:NAD(P)-dependent dehydrogenase (short-subunit alcohol dehydrogenase family)
MNYLKSIVTAFTACFLTLCNAVLALVREFILGHPKARIDPSKCVVVVTGCDSGFGEMTAARLSALGFKVVAGCLTQDGVDRMRAVVASSVLCDVTKESDVIGLRVATESLMESTKSNLWGVVNNAGIAIGGPIDWISLDVYRKVMEVNFFGHVAVTMQMLPLLKRTRDSRILNLSSAAGIFSSANLSAYGASKHALEGFLKSVRHELKPWGIHMSNINPAFMR